MARKKRRNRHQDTPEIEATESVTRRLPADPVPTAPTAAEKLITGDMIYRPIGGNNPDDIGANTGIVEFNRYGGGKGKKTSRIMIDNGVKFADPDSRYDSLMVDTSNYFQDRDSGNHPSEMVDAIVLTHAHEDHIGAICHDMNRGKVLPPIYATPLTQAFVEQSFIRRGFKDPKSWPQFNTMEAGKAIQIGDINIMPIPVSHSVSQSMALAITTPTGSMMHSGDYKADATLPIGQIFEKEQTEELCRKALARYGHERFDVATVDSTRAYMPGSTPTEGKVKSEMDKIVKESNGHRVVTAVMGRSTERIINMAKVAADNDRTLVVHGKSIILSLQALARADQISRGIEARAPKGKGKRSSNAPAYDMSEISDILTRYVGRKVRILEGRDEAVDNIPESKQMVLATGTQGEQNAALPMAAMGNHKTLLLGSNDVVVRSASIIPGNEAPIGAMDSAVRSQGVARLVTTEEAMVHSSGHGYSEDVDQYLESTKARTVIPVHGSVELMEKNAERIATRAQELDLKLEKMRNGDRVVIGQDVIVTPTKEPARFLGIRNTVEDPVARMWKQDYVYEPVDENGKALGPAPKAPANDRKPTLGKRAG